MQVALTISGAVWFVFFLFLIGTGFGTGSWRSEKCSMHGTCQ